MGESTSKRLQRYQDFRPFVFCSLTSKKMVFIYKTPRGMITTEGTDNITGGDSSTFVVVIVPVHTVSSEY